jgi:hypothetical protein
MARRIAKPKVWAATYSAGLMAPQMLCTVAVAEDRAKDRFILYILGQLPNGATSGDIPTTGEFFSASDTIPEADPPRLVGLLRRLGFIFVLPTEDELTEKQIAGIATTLLVW